MILSSRNYIKLFTVFILLFISFFVESKEFNYKFHWLYVPVAKLSINFDESYFEDDKANIFNINFRLSTQGPLKLYRKYSSDGYIRKNNNSSWNYYLSGKDRGQPEEKSITYFIDDAPIINKFVDDANVLPLEVNPDIDKNAIDPFSILMKTIQQLTYEHNCDSTFLIMDGKRRYKAKLKLIGIEYLDMAKEKSFQGNTYHCQLSVFSSEEEIYGEVKGNWPFNGSTRVIEMWFSQDLNFKPVKFQFRAPLGKVIGKLVI